MSLFVPFKRATLLIPSGPVNDPDRKHLFVLLTDPIEAPDFNGKQVLLVNIASVPKSLPYDSTCILQPGEHRFIKHESYVYYAKARIEAANALLRGVKSGQLMAHEIMGQAIVQRICDGLQRSSHTTPRILRFYTLSI
ncbi:MAG: hypothetical protein QX196_12770 [Methylococcaceae bacterium]